jgi:hypothetical protein
MFHIRRRLKAAKQLVAGLLSGAAAPAAAAAGGGYLATPLPVLAHYVRTVLEWVQTALLKPHGSSGV